MRRFIEIEPVCPFFGKPCIKDGWQLDRKIVRPCMFFDENSAMNDEEPCLIMRTVDKVLNRKNTDDNAPVEVPWDIKKE